MKRGVVAIAIGGVWALGAGCDHVVGCAGTGQPAFEVTVVDARSGASIADSAIVYVFELPSLQRVDSSSGQAAPGRIAAGMDRSGRFTVVVERPGYYPWTAENQLVKEDCSVQTVFLTARLIPRGS